MEDVLTSTKIGYGDCTLGLLAPTRPRMRSLVWLDQAEPFPLWG